MDFTEEYMKKIELNRIKEIIRFGIVGVIAVLIQYFVYIVTIPYFGTTIAFTIGYIVSFCCNFIMSNYFTFKTKPSTEKGFKFMLAHCCNYLLQIGLLNVFIFLGIGNKIAALLVQAISVPVNYFLVRRALNKN